MMVSKMGWKDTMRSHGEIPPEIKKQIDTMVEEWKKVSKNRMFPMLWSGGNMSEEDWINQMVDSLRKKLEQRYRDGTWDGTTNYFPEG
jgi:hypothetical protein